LGDVVLRAAHSTVALSNPDRADKVSDLAEKLSLPVAQRALTALERTLTQLNTNMNVRLATEVLFLELPSLGITSRSR